MQSETLSQDFNTAVQDLNPGPLSQESEALPVSHCRSAVPQEIKRSCRLYSFKLSLQKTICCMNEENNIAYFDRQQLTLHPMLIHWRDQDRHELKHKSYMVVSNDRSHKSVAVYAFLKAVLPLVKRHLPQIE